MVGGGRVSLRSDCVFLGGGPCSAASSSTLILCSVDNSHLALKDVLGSPLFPPNGQASSLWVVLTPPLTALYKKTMTRPLPVFKPFHYA